LRAVPEAQIDILVAADPQKREEVESVLADAAGIRVRCFAADGGTAVDWLMHNYADLVLIDNALPGLSGVKLAEWVNREIRETVTVLFGNDAGTEGLRRAMLAGAREFIDWPVSGVELRRTLELVTQITSGVSAGPDLSRADRAASVESRVYALIGAKGGVGTSFIAANLAVSLARSQVGRTALVDMNTRGADLATVLDSKPARTLSDLVPALDELDSEALQATAEPIDAGFDLYAGPAEIEIEDLFGPENVTRLIDGWRSGYETVVIDSGSSMNPTVAAVIGAADVVLPVLVPEVVCVRAASRLIRVLDRRGVSKTALYPIVNRREAGDLSLERISGFIGSEVAGELPSSPAARLTLDEGRLLEGEDEPALQEAFAILARSLGPAESLEAGRE